MRLLIGCPAYKREWILRAWFLHAEEACETVGVVPSYLLVTPRNDPSIVVASTFGTKRGREIKFILTDEPDRPDERNWAPARLKAMVHLRNGLLAEVRQQAPDLFLSVDSDILLHEKALLTLMETIEGYDVVGGKCYLSWPGRECPSYAMLSNQQMLRPDWSGVGPADVVMAIKLMRPTAYAVDYVYHRFGEDIGWSKEVRRRGHRIGFDGRVVSKHVMQPQDLDRVDDRVGY